MSALENVQVGDVLTIEMGNTPLYSTTVTRLLKRYFETTGDKKWDYEGFVYPEPQFHTGQLYVRRPRDTDKRWFIIRRCYRAMKDAALSLSELTIDEVANLELLLSEAVRRGKLKKS
jgi:hypothetical protein